jgi:hypothetical protein
MAENPIFGQNQPSRLFENDLIKLERAQKALLCEISNKLSPNETSIVGVDCDGNPVSVSNAILTVPSPDTVQKVQICGASDIYDAEVVCLSNDDGLTVVTGWEVFNITALGIVTSKLYLNGVDVTGSYVTVPCGVKVKWDYEFEKLCVDGKTWTKTYVYDPTSITPTLVSILWLDENDNPQPDPSPSLINNENCVAVTTPSISDAFGDDLSTLLPGNSFTITKPDCCKIQIVTSIGTFTLREKETYYSTDKYDSAFTIDSVNILSGNCTLDSIHIISNKTK